MESTGWKRVAEKVIERRIELGMLTAKSLADVAGMTPRVVGDIENARRSNYSKGTKALIERCLGWQYGGIDRILAGDEPLVMEGLPGLPTKDSIHAADEGPARNWLLPKGSDQTESGRKAPRVDPRLYGGDQFEGDSELQWIENTVQVALAMIQKRELWLAIQLINQASKDLSDYLDEEESHADQPDTRADPPPATPPRTQGTPGEGEKTRAGDKPARLNPEDQGRDLDSDAIPSSPEVDNPRSRTGHRSDYNLVARTGRGPSERERFDAAQDAAAEAPDPEGPEDGA